MPDSLRINLIVAGVGFIVGANLRRISPQSAEAVDWFLKCLADFFHGR